jgi:hypothetical protein
MHRAAGPPDLQDNEAYDVVYATLFLHALDRTCACCSRPTSATSTSPTPPA